MAGMLWFPERPLLRAKLEKRTCVTAFKVLPEMLNFRHSIRTTRKPFVKLISIPAAALNILLFLPTTVAAQSVVQAGSNISFPAQFDGMTVEASNGAWGDLASSYIYRNGGDRIEVIVYRPSYPSVSLWFTQGERRTKELFSRVPITPAGSPEIFAAKSRNSNGMRRFYTIGAPFASTSIAVVGFGQWIVSIRSSSKTFDVNQQRARLDKIIEQIVVPSSLVESRYPVVPIADCIGSSKLSFAPEGEPPLANLTLEMKLSGGLGAMVASQDAFVGDKGIAAQPSTYCRRQSITGKTVWFESVDAGSMPRWIVPVSETGITVEGMLVPTTNKGGTVEMQGVVLTNDHTQSSVRGFYRQLPNPVSAQLLALTALVAGASPHASVKYGTAEIALVD